MELCKTCRELRLDIINLKKCNNWFVKAFVKNDLKLHLKHKHSKKVNNHDPIKNNNNYFITLTAGGLPKEYCEAINKILYYKKFKVVSGFGVIELTKNNEPHAHIYIECKDYVRKERIERIWKKSFSQIKKVKYDNGIRNYCDKDKDNTKLLEFCHYHKIPRIISLHPALK